MALINLIHITGCKARNNNNRARYQALKVVRIVEGKGIRARIGLGDGGFSGYKHTPR
jgi:hypothetical protein